MSTLNKLITAHRYTDVVSKEDLSLAQENDRPRRENRLLNGEGNLQKGPPVLCEPKATRFRLSKNTEPAFQQIACAMLLVSAPVVYVRSPVVLPAVDKDLIR